MNNTLTRKVLTEKRSRFWNYTDSNNVPKWIWDKTIKSVLFTDDFTNRLYYIIYEIICPLIKTNLFAIDVTVSYTNNQPYRNVIIKSPNSSLKERNFSIKIYHNYLYQIISVEELKVFVNYILASYKTQNENPVNR